eukprot:6731339-Lingulodinium_polyedra.AAC.1
MLAGWCSRCLLGVSGATPPDFISWWPRHHSGVTPHLGIGLRVMLDARLGNAHRPCRLTAALPVPLATRRY